MNIRSIRFATLAVAVVGISTLPSFAEAQGRFRGMARVGLEGGGDTVLQFEYSDGSTPDVTAGGGLLLTGGGVFEAFNVGGHAMEAQANAGLKWRTIPAATNQDANWLRIPVEGLLFYRAPMGLRLGGGATMHLRNVLAASGDAMDERIEFRNTPGWLLQGEYSFGNMSVDLRYTAMEYEVERGGSGTVDASSLGVGVSVLLGRSSKTTAARTPTP